ncbi:MAG: BLUF domain-containing protein [Halieaceae bacterium]|nr:BLUF domain-containing protein [Halieaceae bacterium]
MGRSAVPGAQGADTPEATADRLYTLGYASTQTAPLGTAGLIGLLNEAREFNQKHDITGLLLHRDDSFLQVIEGRKQDVLSLYEQIKQDPRHERVETLFEDYIEDREFSEWQMGFIELGGVDVSLLPGFSNFLVENEEPRSLLERLSRTKRLLLLFRNLS